MKFQISTLNQITDLVHIPKLINNSISLFTLIFFLNNFQSLIEEEIEIPSQV